MDDVKKFDIILNLEVVEHVDDLDLFLKSCSKLLKKNGLIFTATINRTFTSYIKAIIKCRIYFKMVAIGHTIGINL